MTRLHMVFATGILTMALCDAGPNGYLPRAGPAPLRFGPKPSDRPPPELPPLAMSTPKPVDPQADPDAIQTGSAYWLPPETREQPVELLEAASAAANPAPFLGGGIRPSDQGWWQILITNQHGFLTVPAPPVNFIPPAAPPSGSRATYQTRP